MSLGGYFEQVIKVRVKPKYPTPNVSENPTFPSYSPGEAEPTDSMARGKISLKPAAYCSKPGNEKEIAFTLYYQTWLTEYDEYTQWIFLWSETKIRERQFKRTYRAYVLCDGSQTDWSVYYDSDHGQWKDVIRKDIKVLGFITLEAGDELSVGFKTNLDDRSPGFTWTYKKGGGPETGYDSTADRNAHAKAVKAVNSAISEYRRTGAVEDLDWYGINYKLNKNVLEVDFTPLIQPGEPVSIVSSDVYGAEHTLKAPGYIVKNDQGQDAFVPFTDYRTGKTIPLKPGDSIPKDALPPYFTSQMATVGDVEYYEVISITLTDRNDLPKSDEFIIDDVNAAIKVREILRGLKTGDGYPGLALR